MAGSREDTSFPGPLSGMARRRFRPSEAEFRRAERPALKHRDNRLRSRVRRGFGSTSRALFRFGSMAYRRPGKPQESLENAHEILVFPLRQFASSAIFSAGNGVAL